MTSVGQAPLSPRSASGPPVESPSPPSPPGWPCSARYSRAQSTVNYLAKLRPQTWGERPMVSGSRCCYCSMAVNRPACCWSVDHPLRSHPSAYLPSSNFFLPPLQLPPRNSSTKAFCDLTTTALPCCVDLGSSTVSNRFPSFFIKVL